jgi:hypothetical protein
MRQLQGGSSAPRGWVGHAVMTRPGDSGKAAPGSPPHASPLPAVARAVRTGRVVVATKGMGDFDW